MTLRGLSNLLLLEGLPPKLGATSRNRSDLTRLIATFDVAASGVGMRALETLAFPSRSQRRDFEFGNT